MPSLQIDVPVRLDLAAKQELAAALGRAYAEIMEVSPEIITVSVHDLGAGGVWRCTEGDPVPAGLVMCDVRRGRDAAQRGRLARHLVALVGAAAGLEDDQLKVEFTQHTGDEMWHPRLGGFNDDWAPDDWAPDGEEAPA